MTGYKNMGSVKSGKEEPGYYAPSETRINFAVPNDMTKLMPSDVQVPEVNGPGKFNEMINALSDNKWHFCDTVECFSICLWRFVFVEYLAPHVSHAQCPSICEININTTMSRD